VVCREEAEVVPRCSPLLPEWWTSKTAKPRFRSRKIHSCIDVHEPALLSLPAQQRVEMFQPFADAL
jgi:hypothetical protein